MLNIINELTDYIFDPRGKDHFHQLKLAPRPSLQTLRDGKILFFDNTKLDFCHYQEIFTRLETILNEHGIHRIEHVRQSVRGTMTAQIRELADKLVKKEVQAAVVALADMGTSVMTTIAPADARTLPADLRAGPRSRSCRRSHPEKSA